MLAFIELLNECARKKKAKIPQLHSFRVFFVRCVRNCVLNKNRNTDRYNDKILKDIRIKGIKTDK